MQQAKPCNFMSKGCSRRLTRPLKWMSRTQQTSSQVPVVYGGWVAWKACDRCNGCCMDVKGRGIIGQPLKIWSDVLLSDH